MCRNNILFNNVCNGCGHVVRCIMGWGSSMRKLLISMALIMPFQAMASSCEEWSERAGIIMKYRMGDLPMKDLVNAVNGSKKSTDEDKEEGVKLIIKAYDQPRFSSEDYQLRAINRFANDTYKECLKSN
jgi:hypothetical protein